LCRNSKKVLVDDVLVFGNEVEEIRSRVIAKHDDGRVEIIFFVSTEQEVIDFCNRWGEIPLPPYIGKQDIPLATYQTVYAKETGSVAAPTAGFHFTSELIERLEKKGVVFVDVVLHVGIGTFRPMQTELLQDHVMHAEYVEIGEEAIIEINRAKNSGNKVFAIGTTSVRVLEGVAALHGGMLQAYRGEVSLFITPGFEFKVVDALITNFHLPESTLLVLVSAYMGMDYARRAYAHAIEKGYYFYSFGDAMLIL
jgi:S-adenosylmethionine:tRNA ribosyltransferase-isomerase